MNLPVLALGATFGMMSSLTGSTGDAPQAQFTTDWGSLARHKIPDWFRDAKFGIYFHWGIYSVPAFGNEWYSRNMYQAGSAENKHHVTTYGPTSAFGYKDFLPSFRAEHFDPDNWAKLFQDAGARFAGPVSEHADGFAMWDSKLTKWNAAQMGPHRDVVGEMARAVRKRGLKFATSFHHQWLWGWYANTDPNSDVYNPDNSGLYGPANPPASFDYGNPKPAPDDAFCTRWAANVHEVVERYRPDLIYFDSRMSIIPERYRQEMVADYYNHAQTWGHEVVLTYKKPDMPDSVAVEDLERGRMAEISPIPWMTDDAIDWNSWCDVVNPNYKSAKRLIDELVDIVSKNGCFLLDITPRADGTIPDPVRERLLTIGSWLKRNGEAIYGTRPYSVYGEGPTSTIGGAFGEEKIKDLTAQDVRYTTKKETLYAIVMGAPDVAIRLHAPVATANKVARITLIGSRDPVRWSKNNEGIVIEPPIVSPSHDAIVYKLALH